LPRCCFRAIAAFLQPLRPAADDPTRIFHTRGPERRFPNRLMSPALLIRKSDSLTPGFRAPAPGDAQGRAGDAARITNRQIPHVFGKKCQGIGVGDRETAENVRTQPQPPETDCEMQA